MAHIVLSKASVDFPIYSGANRSLKKAVLRVGSGGRIATDAGDRLIVQALKKIDLSIQDGDRIGLIGPNGSGKTTLLRLMAGVYEPVSGSISVHGNVTPLFDAHLGMEIEATGLENIYIRGLYLGMTPQQIREKTPEIAAFTELGDYLSMPVRMYSSGMMLRLAFAVSTCVAPEVLLMDEWIGVSDPSFLEKAEARMQEFVGKANIMVLATHRYDLIKRVCNKVILLRQGEIAGMGPPGDFDSFFVSTSHPA